ncbi:IPTL-CTERM sorting domain-containing protein [Diaphorobacter ruginosibacter]|uniref:IPTL-CTERM sorting domain-containing protein n=1 Tax=Diaphorobacter ruginosibacter TaxID=1715720 RepID=A0A7G9RJC8_9BURK|nr:IPTL-CTERM sorting domain-containing protein [Diaphorobacter ruginosibacter]QNN55703.1 IPTL-CTERM sorting domain-containing protein [Diaphorobacter ruginosibacter]
MALQAAGGVAPYAWSATGLPGDLTIDPATGIISGTPTVAGTSQFTVTVTDDAGQVKRAQFTIVVDPLDLTVTTQALPGGQVGQAYNASIVVAGGVSPYSFTLTGDLPEGLTLNPATGAITGKPTKAQTSTFSVTIEDSTLQPQSAMAKAAVHSVTQSFSITVAAAPVVAAPTPVPTLGEWGVIALSSLLAMFGLARSRRRQG